MKNQIIRINVVLQHKNPFVFIDRERINKESYKSRMYQPSLSCVSKLAAVCDSLAHKGQVEIVPTAFGWWVDFEPWTANAHPV